jgi:starvation-inducible outer membrane lipoprotein
MRQLIAVAVALMLAGCASYDPPKPWERGELARPSMQFDHDRLNARAEAHIYTSKEAAAGGYGVGGGGCGCN